MSAVLVTLAGPMTPALTRSSNLPVPALKPIFPADSNSGPLTNVLARHLARQSAVDDQAPVFPRS